MNQDEWVQLQNIADQFRHPGYASPSPSEVPVESLLVGQRISNLRPVAVALVAHVANRKANS